MEETSNEKKQHKGENRGGFGERERNRERSGVKKQNEKRRKKSEKLWRLGFEIKKKEEKTRASGRKRSWGGKGQKQKKITAEKRAQGSSYPSRWQGNQRRQLEEQEKKNNG